LNEDKFPILRRILASKALVPESEIQLTSDLFEDLELDSLCLIEAFLEIQSEFNVKLHPAELGKDKLNTPEKILALL
jgi:acyl carrier protein